MKWYLSIFFLIYTTSSFTSEKTSSNVYICTGAKAYSYHKKHNCRGLNRCSGGNNIHLFRRSPSIKKTTL